jgi:hypothetical protein
MNDLGRVTNWPKHAWIKASTTEMDGELDDFVVSNALLPIVTPRLRELLDEQETPGVEWLPVIAIDSKGAKRECLAMNRKRLLENALERARWDITLTYPADAPTKELRNQIQGAWKVALRLKAITPYDEFRVADFPRALFVSSTSSASLQ